MVVCLDRPNVLLGDQNVDLLEKLLEVIFYF